MSLPQAISDGFNGCCGGTQVENFSSNVLSSAWLGDRPNVQSSPRAANSKRILFPPDSSGRSDLDFTIRAHHIQAMAQIGSQIVDIFQPDMQAHHRADKFP